MITKFKVFEKIGEINPKLNLGWNLNEGMLGFLMDKQTFDEIPFIINYLKEKDIKYRLLLDDEQYNQFIFLFSNDEVKKLPRRAVSNYLDYYIPFRFKIGYDLGWFYQDVIDERNWKEVTINTDEDMDDLNAYLSSFKYNL